MWACLVCVVAVAGCSNLPPVDPPPPPVAPAPLALRGVAIHVHQLVTPAETAQDDWEYHHMPGLTGELRRAFVTALQGAGYTVVVDRHMPHDVVALIQADWPWDRDGTATLALSAGDTPLGVWSAAIPNIGQAYPQYLEADAAVALIEALSRAPALRDFADAQRPPAAVIASDESQGYDGRR